MLGARCTGRFAIIPSNILDGMKEISEIKNRIEDSDITQKNGVTNLERRVYLEKTRPKSAFPRFLL